MRITTLRYRLFGFTLLEMLAAMTVFVFLLLFVGKMISSTNLATNASKNRLESDDQARLALDRIGDDLARMVKRSDLDYLFDPETGDDSLYFYSEVPAFSSASSGQSGVALVGYRVKNSRLERYAGATLFDAGTNSLKFLTFPTGSNTPDPATALQLPADNSDYYHVLADNVFRLEIVFLLKDGSYSTKPVLYNTPSASDWPSSAGAFFTKAGSAPTGVSVGARWYDTSTKRAYIATGQNSTGLIWRPLGWADVAAVVVTIATLDSANRTTLEATNTSLAGVTSQLSDASDSDLQGGLLPAENWQSKVTSLSAVSPKIAAGLRIYQRYFYLAQ